MTTADDLKERIKNVMDKLGRVSDRNEYECEQNPLTILGMQITFDAITNLALVILTTLITIGQQAFS